jgi:SlyX protein
MTEEDYEKRFIDLEMKLAYLEDFMNQLQEVAVEQAKTIEILKKENRIISGKLQEVSDSMELEIPNRNLMKI